MAGFTVFYDRMNILHIYKTYYPYSVGGIEKHIYGLSESLYKAGIHSTVLTTKASMPAHSGSIGQTAVHYFPSNINIASCPMSITLLNNFRRIVRDFDILHYHFPWPFADLTHLLTQVNKPTVVTYHSDIIRQKWLNKIYQPVRNLFLQRANAIIASSTNYYRSSPVLRKYSHKMVVIPYGLDRSQYAPAEDQLLQRWEDQVGKDFFLFVGVLRYYKGLDFLLEAARNTSLRVVIAGSGPEGARLMQAAKNMPNVIFTGHITEADKAALHQLCRATVAPSHLRTEAFCISLLESLIFGKPAISTELNTGTSFVNQHNISGLVVPPANPQALQEAMKLLLKDDALYHRLVNGTQTHYTQFFTAEAMLEKHIELYNKVKQY